MARPIKIIDLFAGPGGLGEGFSRFSIGSGERPFRIATSIEKETSAHRTLLLRAFFRQFSSGAAPREYYDFLTGKLGTDPEDGLYRIPKYSTQVNRARQEARRLELGRDNQTIDLVVKQALGPNADPWILIGGPPCQAYSLAGRVRNRGIEDYKPETDDRHFLYQEYLRIISQFQPAIFVMENVKGLLSATVDGDRIFHRILADLANPHRAIRTAGKQARYHLLSLVAGTSSVDMFGATLDPRAYVVRAEHYGVPQARHRVILIGIRDDLLNNSPHFHLEPAPSPSVRDVIGDLPALRSGLSKEHDGFEEWVKAVQINAAKTIAGTREKGLIKVADKIKKIVKSLGCSSLGRGSNWGTASTTLDLGLPRKLRNWYLDESGWRGVCNHETRGHIREDLQRYLFCACYGSSENGEAQGSPKSEDFPRVLAPHHANWESGHFADRYRVQVAHRHATTITSHISKDGHYFIHYDPTQCRSLTVREAARIQTFPDNYFFVGNRTQQYVQVGNAVPPYLAHQVARAVFSILT